jgi:hypothetical protein
MAVQLGVCVPLQDSSLQPAVREMTADRLLLERWALAATTTTGALSVGYGRGPTDARSRAKGRWRWVASTRVQLARPGQLDAAAVVAT